jgi:intein/homing endonuclease
LADGYVSHRSFAVEVVEADAMYLRELLLKQGIAFTSSRRERPKRQPQVSLRVSTSDPFCDVLRKLGVVSGRNVPNLEALNKEAFLLGLLDGDGNIYMNRKTGTYQCTFSGKFDQSWDFLESILAASSISGRVQRVTTNKGHKYSAFRIVGLTNLQLLRDCFKRVRVEGLERKRAMLTDLVDRRTVPRVRDRQNGRFC